jgi:phage terminase large subunit
MRLTKPLRIIPGGSSASKTFGILSQLIDHAIKNSMSEIDVVGSDIPMLRRGAVTDFKKILKWTNRWRDEQFNRTTLTYNFTNGSTISFFSADSEAKVRGARRQILYLNEGNRINFETFYALRIRTSMWTIIDFNPTSEFWAHQEYENDPDAEWLTLTYKDNEAAPEAAIKELEKAKAKGEAGNDYWRNFYNVYGRGLPGKLQGAVFQNWQEGDFVEKGIEIFGQDYGFSKDENTLVKTCIDTDRRIIYAQECFYKTGLTTSEIRSLNTKYAGTSLIVADVAEKRLIHELKTGSPRLNMAESIKGPDSINYGISLMQDYQMIVKGQNLIKELKGYIWLDKGTPKALQGDHIIDALRYAVTYQLINKNKGTYHILT